MFATTRTAHGKPSTLKLGGAGGSEDVHETSFDNTTWRLQMLGVAEFIPSTVAFVACSLRLRQWSDRPRGVISYERSHFWERLGRGALKTHEKGEA